MENKKMGKKVIVAFAVVFIGILSVVTISVGITLAFAKVMRKIVSGVAIVVLLIACLNCFRNSYNAKLEKMVRMFKKKLQKT